MSVYLGSVDPQFTAVGQTIATPFGILTAPTTRVAAFVYSGGYAPGMVDTYIYNNQVTTLAAGLARCRSGLGDTVFVMPGHQEYVSDATMLQNLVAGTNIVGIGNGQARPKFTWNTAVTANWPISVANCLFQNLVLSMTGFANITKGITVTGADTTICDCDIICGTTTYYAAIPVEFGTGSDRSVFCRNLMRCTVTTPTEYINIAGTPDMVCIANNVLMGTAGSGLLLNVAAAATHLRITGNHFWAYDTAGATAINIANAASSGFLHGNCLYIQNAGAAETTGINFNAGASVIRCGLNYNADESQKSGALCPGVSA